MKKYIPESIFFLVGVLFFNEAIGCYLYSDSQDIENHFLIAKYLSEASDLSLIPYPLLSLYPPLSHWLVVIVAPLFGSLLAAFTKVSVITVIIIYYCIFRYIEKFSNLHAFLLFGFLLLSIFLEFGVLGNEVIKNFFFPQLISSCFGVLLIYFIINEKRFINNIEYQIYLYLLIAIGYCIHPTVILIVAGAYIIKILLVALMSKKLSSFYSFKSLLPIFSVMIITLIVPYNRTMSKIALNNGHLPIGFLADPYSITTSGVLFILICLLIALIYLWNHIARSDDSISFDNKCTIACVVVSATVISIAHLLLTKLGVSTYYAAKKSVFIITTFTCILLSIIISDQILSKINSRSINKYLYKRYKPSLALFLTFILVAFIFWNKQLMSISVLNAIGNECIKLQERIGLPARQKTIVQLPINGLLNFILSSCYIDYPKREVLLSILKDKITNELQVNSGGDSLREDNTKTPYNYIITSKDNLFSEKANSGKIFNYRSIEIISTADYTEKFTDPYPLNTSDIIFTNNKNVNNRVFLCGISKVEDWGSWSDGDHTRIQLHIQHCKENNLLILSVVPFIHGFRSKFQAFYTINYKKYNLGVYSAKNLPETTINIPFKKTDLDSRNNLIVDFYYTDLMPCFKASGLVNGDPREVSFGFRRISLN